MGELLVRNLTKHQGKHLVIDRVDLHVRDQEFMVLLGPEQSGKTTFLRLICGLEEPDTGEIWIDQKNVTHLAPEKRNVGMVFQSNRALHQNMTVYENIGSSLRNHGVSASGLEMQVVATAHMLGIGHLLQRKTSTLAGGEMQKVALARVLIRKAQVYLFDEPLTHLDLRDRHQAWQEMLMSHRLKSQASVYVTREPAEAIALGQRIAMFGYGRIHQVGSAQEIQQTPANTFVAQFMSTPSMNILTGYLQATYQQPGLRYRILNRSFSLLLPAAWNDALQRFDAPDILMGIRADALAPLRSTAERAAPNVARAVVLSIERHAKSSTLQLRLGGGEELAALFHLAPYQRIEPGQPVDIGIDPERVLLFHPLTQVLLRRE